MSTPMLLFQRLIKVAQTTPEKRLEYFFFKLTNIPSLFQPSGLPRKAEKRELSKYLWSLTNQQHSEISDSFHHVLDGGALLHKLPWSKSLTYGQLIDCYVNFVEMALQLLSSMATKMDLQQNLLLTYVEKVDIQQHVTSTLNL